MGPLPGLLGQGDLVSHWDQAPFVAVCADCAFHVQAINAETGEVAMNDHTQETRHHLYAISQA